MKFQLYLKEGRSQQLSFEGFLKYAPKCKNSIKNYHYQGKGTLYRGIGGRGNNFDSDTDSYSYDEFMSIDPKKFEREPNYARNKMYFLMIDTLPSWSGYPSRRHSVVGATHGGKAEDYSGLGFYQMFPEDSAKLAVCSGQDLWASFGRVFDTPDYAEVLGSFTNALMAAIYETTHKNVDVSTMSGFRAMCNTFDELHRGHLREDFIDNIKNENDELIEFYRRYYKGNLYKAFDTAFAPGPNGIKIVRPGTSLPEDKEWWTDGFCLMMSVGTELSNEQDEQLRKAVGMK